MDHSKRLVLTFVLYFYLTIRSQTAPRFWIHLSENKVVAKGKGELQTYWLSVSGIKAGSGDNSSDDGAPALFSHVSNKIQTKHTSSAKVSRLIEWNVQVMTQCLKHIVARRNAAAANSDLTNVSSNETSTKKTMGGLEIDDKMTIDEVCEIIKLPEYKASVVAKQENPELIELSTTVTAQLNAIVTNVAAMYRDNASHCFEHASHVVMSVTKLLSRIVAPDLEFHENSAEGGKTLHDHTYGITSDPLTQFACVFSALIHDVDHLGIPNAQIVKEKLPLANHYKNQSVAEQNSGMSLLSFNQRIAPFSDF
jgi:hypothetical protein